MMDPEKYKKIVKILAVVVTLLVIWLVKVNFFNNPTLITITGEGKILTQPEIVTFTIGIANSSDSALNAMNDNNRIKNDIINVIKNEGGVWEKDIVVSYPRVVPPTAGVSNAYQSVNTIDVTLNDINRFDNLVNKLYSSGIYSLSNIVFTTQNSENLEKEVIDLAVKNGQARAKELARSMGKRVGRMVTIQTTEVGAAGALVGKTQSQGGGQMMTSPSQIEIVRQASIVFELKPWFSL